MTRIDDGGRIAARGFQYQYLRTLEAMLDHVDTDVTAVRVEGPAGDERVESVDFDVVDPHGEVRYAAQVKSAAAGRTVSAAEAFGQLIRLVVSHEAGAYALLTNAAPEPSARSLAAALEADLDGQGLREAVVDALSSAPTRRSQAEALTGAELDRLSRARIRFDARDISEICGHLNDRLRAYRGRSRKGLGFQSAGLLLHALAGEMLRRAADSTASAFTMSEFRDHLLLDNDTLMHAMGAMDSGVVVGAMAPVPDVARPMLYDQVVSAFATPSPSTRLAVLVGPSGIGKSSLTAAYVADQAFSYDVIFWIDGESDRSLEAGFRLLCSYLVPASSATHEQLDARQLRAASHTQLARFPGRWLMVIDNAVDVRRARAWIPSAGRGDAILTTIDAVAPQGAAAVVTMDVMRPDEAETLLQRRLRVTGTSAADYRPALRRLSEAMSYWPLALELAAGYLNSCGVAVDGIDAYIDQLQNRALDDDYAVPVGYPRTLVAAIGLCIQHIRDEVTATNSDRILLASGMLYYAACLSSRQIPIHLLAAAVALEPSDEPAFLGPIILDPTRLSAIESIRELRRYSLVSFDTDLPQTPTTERVDSHRTITMNSIVQHIVRSMIEIDETTPDAYDRLAAHVERWLSSAIQLNLLQRADVMFTHADALAKHLQQADLSGPRIALLFGNLAGAHRLKGNIAATEDLLHRELDLLDRSSEPNELLAVQVKLSLAEMAIQEASHSSTTIKDATQYLEHVLRFSQRISASHPDAAAKLLHQVWALLNTPAGQATGSDELAVIGRTSHDLLGYIGPSKYTAAANRVLDANTRLSEGDTHTAEQLCRRALDDDVLTGHTELMAHRLLLESIAAQRRWSDARNAFDEIRQYFGAASGHHDIVTDLVHNTGMHCASQLLLLGGDGAAADLLTALVTWPTLQAAQQRVTDGYRARIRFLAVLNDAANGDETAAHQYCASVSPVELVDGTAQESSGWLRLWQCLRVAATSPEFHATGTNHLS